MHTSNILFRIKVDTMPFKIVYPNNCSTSNKTISKESAKLLVHSGTLKGKQSNVEPTKTITNAFIISGHQPTILPYPGFFYRMYHSNIMDICPYDPFSKHSDRYQHRVKIGTDNKWEWFNLPVEAYTGCSIMEAKLKTHLMNDRWATLERVYAKYPLWVEYKDDLHTIFFGYTYLWEVNFRFILWIRDLLNIKTYVSISYEGKGKDTTERIASQFADYGSVVYLAGNGSSQYLDIARYEQLTNSTVALVTYVPPTPFSTVSILTPLLMYPPNKVLETLKIVDEPIEVIVNGLEKNLDKRSKILDDSCG
jgi:hypothetical protein